MFGTASRSSVLDLRVSQRVRPSRASRVGLYVGWSLRSLPVLLEAKSVDQDTRRRQLAICQQFHWLLSSQILFRREEIR